MKERIAIAVVSIASAAVAAGVVREVELETMKTLDGCHVVCPEVEPLHLDGTEDQHRLANTEPLVDYRGDEDGELNNRAGW